MQNLIFLVEYFLYYNKIIFKQYIKRHDRLFFIFKIRLIALASFGEKYFWEAFYQTTLKEVKAIDNNIPNRKKTAYRFDIICNSRIMEDQIANNPEYQIVEPDDEKELF